MTTPATPALPPRPWPDNPHWDNNAAAGHWTSPPDCGHPADRVLGPCTCHWTGP